MVWVLRNLKDHLSSNPCHGHKHHQIRLPETQFSLTLRTSRYWVSTASLGKTLDYAVTPPSYAYTLPPCYCFFSLPKRKYHLLATWKQILMFLVPTASQSRAVIQLMFFKQPIRTGRHPTPDREELFLVPVTSQNVTQGISRAPLQAPVISFTYIFITHLWVCFSCILFLATRNWLHIQ